MHQIVFLISTCLLIGLGTGSMSETVTESVPGRDPRPCDHLIKDECVSKRSPKSDYDSISWRDRCCYSPSIVQCITESATNCTQAKSLAEEWVVSATEKCLENGAVYGKCPLTAGGIAGIVVGTLAGIAIIGAVIAIVVIRHKRSASRDVA